MKTIGLKVFTFPTQFAITHLNIGIHADHFAVSTLWVTGHRERVHRKNNESTKNKTKTEIDFRPACSLWNKIGIEQKR